MAPWMIAIAPDAQNGLAKPSGADAFQIRSVSQERLAQRIGALNNETIKQILQAVKIVIGTQ